MSLHLGGNGYTPAYKVPYSALHIYRWAARDAPQHVLDDAGSCWCAPVPSLCASAVVWAHSGRPQPSVTRSLHPHVDLFPTPPPLPRPWHRDPTPRDLSDACPPIPRHPFNAPGGRR